MLRFGFLLVLTLLASAGALAQTAPDKPTGHLPPPPAAIPEIITDLSRLPPPVARTRERILTAARSGDLAQLAALVNEAKPVFSFTDEKDPVAFWKANYPDSGGIEVLSIATMILELGFVRVDEGTQHEMYVWPYRTHVARRAHAAAEGRALSHRHRRRLPRYARVRRLLLLSRRDRARRHLAFLR